MERMNERCCPKPKPYRPDFYVKELKKIWPADEEMKQELRLYDEAHSNEKCINMEYFNALEKELYVYAFGMRAPMCEMTKNSMIDCLNEATCLSKCNDKINAFLACVNKTIQAEYAPKSE